MKNHNKVPVEIACEILNSDGLDASPILLLEDGSTQRGKVPPPCKYTQLAPAGVKVTPAHFRNAWRKLSAK